MTLMMVLMVTPQEFVFEHELDVQRNVLLQILARIPQQNLDLFLLDLLVGYVLLRSALFMQRLLDLLLVVMVRLGYP